MTKQEEFETAIDNNDYKKVKLLLADRRGDPAADSNSAIRCASRNGNTEVVKLLSSDPSVYPAASANYAIVKASENGHSDVVNLLWKNKKVKETLKNNDLNLFNSLTQLDIKEKIKSF